LNFYIKMVSSGAFWVAIIYRLAACFTGMESTCGVEIYWRSFRHFGNYNYSLRKTVGERITKMGQKLIKIAQNGVVFVHFPYSFSYKITSWKSRGGTCPSAP